MAKSKLNALTEALTKIDVDTHPLFVRLWHELGFARVRPDNVEDFKKAPGLALLFLADDPVKFKETLDMAVIAPEICKMFDGTLSAWGFADPAQGRAIASSMGIHRLPSVVVLRFGESMGSIDGLKSWKEYETELVKILTAPAEPKKTIAIATA